MNESLVSFILFFFVCLSLADRNTSHTYFVLLVLFFVCVCVWGVVIVSQWKQSQNNFDEIFAENSFCIKVHSFSTHTVRAPARKIRSVCWFPTNCFRCGGRSKKKKQKFGITWHSTYFFSDVNNPWTLLRAVFNKKRWLEELEPTAFQLWQMNKKKEEKYLCKIKFLSKTSKLPKAKLMPYPPLRRDHNFLFILFMSLTD